MRLTHAMLTVLKPSGGGLLPFTDNFTRADGDLGNGWDYAAGIWTISSNVVSSAPRLGAEILVNGGFETGDPPSEWTAIDSATLSSVEDERTGGSGSKSMNVVRGTGQDVARQMSSSGSGAWLHVNAWLKNIDATNVQVGGRGQLTSTSMSWTEVRGTHVATSAEAYMQFRIVGAAGTQGRIDDYSLKPITLADCFATREFGSANVKVDATLTLPFGTIAGIIIGLDDPAAPSTFVAVTLARQGGAIASLQNPLVYVHEYVAGTRVKSTLLGSMVFADGDTLSVRKADRIVSIFSNDYQYGQDVRIDAAIDDGTRHGIISCDASNLIGQVHAEAAASFALAGDNDAIFSTITSMASLWSGAGAEDWQGRPVLADDGTTWIALYRIAPSHYSGGKFTIRFSEDEGATWTNANTFTDGGAVTGAPFEWHGANNNATDGIVIVAPNGDLLIHIYENGSTARGSYQWRSTDGGATWTDEGRILDSQSIISGQHWFVLDGVIYMPVSYDPEGDGAFPFQVRFYKSADNGTTWELQGEISSVAGVASETSVVSIGGTNLVALLRDNSNTGTYRATSSDMGVTWSALEHLPYMRVQRPRIYKFSGGILAVGRDYVLSNASRPVIWYSPDDGATWGRKYHPYGSNESDTGYSDVLQRTDGKFYFLTYLGTEAAASVYRSVFEITP